MVFIIITKNVHTTVDQRYALFVGKEVEEIQRNKAGIKRQSGQKRVKEKECG